MYTINLRSIVEINKLAPKDDVRYYLNGVYLELSPEKSRYVVTNGHYMVIINAPCTEDRDPLNLIIPKDALAKIKLKKRDDDFAKLEKTGDNEWMITHGMDKYVFMNIDGQFPEWRRIVPKRTDLSREKLVMVNWNYVYAINDCYDRIRGIRGGTVLEMYTQDKLKPVVMGNNDFIGIIMPIRAEEETSLPDWMDQP